MLLYLSNFSLNRLEVVFVSIKRSNRIRVDLNGQQWLAICLGNQSEWKLVEPNNLLNQRRNFFVLSGLVVYKL